jgi:hypothetical protein
MRKIAVATVVAVLAFAAQASALYFITHDTAVDHARTTLHDLGYTTAHAGCHPGFLTLPEPGTAARFHVWNCDFAAGDGATLNCTGLMTITGSVVHKRWYFVVVRHHGPCPHALRFGK